MDAQITLVVLTLVRLVIPFGLLLLIGSLLQKKATQRIRKIGVRQWILKELGLVLFGLILRLGVPVGITLLIVRWLARLDARWLNEARRISLASSPQTQIRNTGCWEVKHCTPAQKAKCPGFAHQETPCWQLFRQTNGALRERCIGCIVFKQAPIPIPQ